jgi:DNA-binding FadR family transcriptional regulator
VDVVIQHLRREIEQGTLAPGARIPAEAELTSQLGVSRTTLREAVVVLSHDGLVDVRQGSGTYVSARPLARESLEQRLGRAAVLELHEVRHCLELEAARLAAVRRTDQEVVQLRQLLVDRDTAQRAGSNAQVVELDVAFHGLIAVASRNAVLADLYRTVTQGLRAAPNGVARDGAQSADTSDLGDTLVDEVANRDADAAVRAAERLFAVEAAAGKQFTDAEVPFSALGPSARRGPRAKHAR